MRYYVHNKENFTEEKIEEINALPLDSLFRVLDRIETSFEKTRPLEINISAYLSGIRSGLPSKQERRTLAKLNKANARLEELRDAA